MELPKNQPLQSKIWFFLKKKKLSNYFKVEKVGIEDIILVLIEKKLISFMDKVLLNINNLINWNQITQPVKKVNSSNGAHHLTEKFVLHIII